MTSLTFAKITCSHGFLPLLFILILPKNKPEIREEAGHVNITLNAKINDLQSQLNTKMSKGKLQISAIQEKLGKVEEDSTQLNATFIENDEELEVQI